MPTSALVRKLSPSNRGNVGLVADFSVTALGRRRRERAIFRPTNDERNTPFQDASHHTASIDFGGRSTFDQHRVAAPLSLVWRVIIIRGFRGYLPHSLHVLAGRGQVDEIVLYAPPLGASLIAAFGLPPISDA
jgi:hypothetical protein